MRTAGVVWNRCLANCGVWEAGDGVLVFCVVQVIRNRIMSSDLEGGEEGSVCTRMYGRNSGRRY